MDDVGQFDREEEVFSACGAAALYRRRALESVARSGGEVFDERLFMYCEDVDLGWRLQRAGWGCWYAPRAVVYHVLSATGGGTLASYYVARNLWLVLARSVPRGLLRPYRPRIATYHAGRFWRAVRHAREPAARATLRGTRDGIIGAITARDRAPSVDGCVRDRLLAQLHDSR
jgi:GT2 family glycosyltransferase